MGDLYKRVKVYPIHKCYLLFLLDFPIIVRDTEAIDKI